VVKKAVLRYDATHMKKIKKALAKYWGFETFLPLQRQAMECINRGTDSVVVLPRTV